MGEEGADPDPPPEGFPLLPLERLSDFAIESTNSLLPAYWPPIDFSQWANTVGLPVDTSVCNPSAARLASLYLFSLCGPMDLCCCCCCELLL